MFKIIFSYCLILPKSVLIPADGHLSGAIADSISDSIAMYSCTAEYYSGLQLSHLIQSLSLLAASLDNDNVPRCHWQRGHSACTKSKQKIKTPVVVLIGRDFH